MILSRKYLLYFGPLTVAIEWIGLLLVVLLAKDFDYNNALSTLTTAPSPLSSIFISTLVLAGFSYSLFCFALKPYSRKIPAIGVVSGALFALTGILVYTGDGGLGDILHNLAITSAVIGYSSIIYLMKNHTVPAVQRVSRILFRVFVVGVILSALALYVLNRYIAITQLAILIVIQIWTITIFWHDRKIN